MVLAKIAMYIFLIAALIVLSYKAIWVAYLFLSFRFVQIVVESFFPDLISDWSTWVIIVFYAVLGIMFATAIYFSTFPFVIVRYIILIILAVVVLTQFSISEIFFFTDFYEEVKVFNLKWLSGQFKELFSIDREGILGFFSKFADMILNFFRTIF